MKLTITNDDGEVYAVARDARRDPRTGRWTVTDEEGETTMLDTLMQDGEAWELANQPEPHNPSVNKNRARLGMPLIGSPEANAEEVGREQGRWARQNIPAILDRRGGEPTVNDILKYGPDWARGYIEGAKEVRP